MTRSESTFVRAFSITLGVVLAVLIGISIFSLVVGFINKAKKPSNTKVYRNLSNQELAQIELKDPTIESSPYDKPHVKGVLINKFQKNISDPVLKVSLFKNQNTNCDSQADDTEYVVLTDVIWEIKPNDSKSFRDTINTNFDTSGVFNYCIQLSQAETQI